MPRGILLVTVLGLAAVTCLPALSVKVVAVDHDAGHVVLLLPVHHTQIEVLLLPGEREVRLRVNRFYEAEIETGKVDTVKQNILKIKMTGERPVRFRLRKIAFLGG